MTQGSLSEWSAAASMLFAPGCEAQSLALIASFASLLMPFIANGSGGACLSLHGGTKRGKTVAAAAAESVWPERPPRRTYLDEAHWTDTAPQSVVIDNLAHRDPVRLSEMFEAFMSPPEKRKRAQIVISVSPLALGAVPGLEVEVQVPRALLPPKGQEKRLAAQFLHNRGVAGERFAAWLEMNERWARRHTIAAHADLREKIGAGAGDLRPDLRLLAACAVAGRIISEMRLADFAPARIETWALKQVRR